MGVDTHHMCEFVGDSNQFTEEGSNFVRRFLHQELEGDHLVEYGFTGHITGKELDINSFVNEYFDKNPDQAYKVLANVLGQTHVALTKWGTKGSSRVYNFMVVYTMDGMTHEPVYNERDEKIGGYTTFGDDIVISDNLLHVEDGDKMVCVEGGAQSFRQVLNVLEHGVSVTLVYNVRKPENEPYFSAARFLNEVSKALAAEGTLSVERVQEIYDTYKAPLKSLWDLRRADHRTKRALFESAIKDFIDKRLYERIESLCTFHDAIA